MSAQNRADIALIVVAVVWGATFLPMANVLKTNGVFVMLFCRFFSRLSLWALSRLNLLRNLT
ncbi:hypothetical protein [Campylobacter concisus]|uniref:hypothetical protein n=1 Tax=Campylobacter concisus TaxID=199 RepID=UPI0021CC83BB